MTSAKARSQSQRAAIVSARDGPTSISAELLAHVPPAPRGNGRLDRNVCSRTVSPFSDAEVS